MKSSLYIITWINLFCFFIPLTAAANCGNTVGTENNAIELEDKNEFLCSCGTNTCTLSTGMFCISSRSSCFHYQSNVLENFTLRHINDKLTTGGDIGGEYLNFNDTVSISSEWKAGSGRVFATSSVNGWVILDADGNR